MSLLIVDLADPQRYLELRGELANAGQQPPPDAASRIILYMRVDWVARP